MIKATTKTILLTLATAGTLSLASGAHADITTVSSKSSVTKVKSAAGVGGARFDWLAKRNTANQPTKRIVQTVSLGKGTWVCSPAGFSRSSRCFKR